MGVTVLRGDIIGGKEDTRKVVCRVNSQYWWYCTALQLSRIWHQLGSINNFFHFYRWVDERLVLGWGDVQFLAEDVSMDHSLPSAKVATCHIQSMWKMRRNLENFRKIEISQRPHQKLDGNRFKYKEIYWFSIHTILSIIIEPSFCKTNKDL